MHTAALDPVVSRQRGIARAVTAVIRRLTGRRILFVLAACALVSTQALFQPFMYQAFSLGHFARTWFDALVECALMAVPILVALTIAEVAAMRRGRLANIVLAALALGAGAVAGAFLILPYFGQGWSDAASRGYASDVLYWSTIGGGVTALYVFQQHAAAAVAQLHRAQVAQRALSKQMLETRLQVMRAQIEPHFLFNTLANVKRLCRTKPEAGIAMLENLVCYLRAALPRMRDAQSTLGQEADLVQAYLAVLRIRLGHRLRYDVDVPPALREQPFAPMLLLTLVENAVKHGITPSARGGSIRVHAQAAAGSLVVRVSDSGVGFGAAPTEGSGVGLANTRARLAALFGTRAELVLTANEPTGVVATIKVPLARALAA
jgi:hypothetical protein